MYNKGINRFNRIIMFAGLLCVFYSCEQESDGNGLSDNQISGLVTLENQTEHDGIIVYLSGANVGAVTDIEGNFILSIPDTVDTSGVFALYYYHTNYDLGLLEIHVEGNSIISNLGDVDEDNYLPTKQLEQVFEISQTVDETVLMHGDYLRGTFTVKNVYHDTIEIGMKEYIGDSLVRDWVLFNVLGFDYSNWWKEDNLLERYWETLAPGDESLVTFAFSICTTGCSSVEFSVIPGEYYYIPMIYPVTGHPYAPYIPIDLWQFLYENHSHIFYEEFVYDAHINLDRLGYLMITIQ